MRQETSRREAVSLKDKTTRKCHRRVAARLATFNKFLIRIVPSKYVVTKAPRLRSGSRSARESPQRHYCQEVMSREVTYRNGFASPLCLVSRYGSQSNLDIISANRAAFARAATRSARFAFPFGRSRFQAYIQIFTIAARAASWIKEFFRVSLSLSLSLFLSFSLASLLFDESNQLSGIITRTIDANLPASPAFRRPAACIDPDMSNLHTRVLRRALPAARMRNFSFRAFGKRIAGNANEREYCRIF